MDLAFRAVDADQHYYEALDACTRHLDRDFRDRGVQVVQHGKHTLLLAGGNRFRFIPNPTFDPIIVPGCLDTMFRGQVPDGVDPRTLTQVEPLRREYQDPATRVRILDEQGLDRILMFPTLGCGVEQALRFDIPATMATLRAFNRWLEEDWTFAYDGRLIVAPMISLADPAEAVTEIDYLVEHGAHMVHVRPAPVPDGHGLGYSLGDARHDPVWARLAEASIPVAFHLGDSGYEAYLGAAWGGSDKFEPFRGIDPLTKLVVSDRAIHDTIGSLVVHGVFTRHPGLRVASIENGSDWMHTLVKRLKKQANQTPWVFADDPLDMIRAHVWVTPYYEENLRRLADLIGVERVLFGSDWPHGEGLANPTGFVKELHDFSDAEIRMVMRDNALTLLRGEGTR
jgi:predicted TIM-barrel fold metal-dependent hydrolase